MESSNLKEFMNEIQSIEAENKKDKIMTSKNQLERLLSSKWQNPYDILMMDHDATAEEIKKMYRKVILH